MRFDDSPDLFGVGIGCGTVGPVICEWCGISYNEDNEDPETGDVIDATVDSVTVTHFADKQICDCCFEKIENEVFKRMPDILKWYREIVELERKKLDKAEKELIKIGA